MAGNVKGITIEFRGKTTDLDKAIKKIQRESKSLDSQLREVNRALKFNPGNTELIRQKFDLLNQKINKTDQDLNELRNTEKQLKAQNVSKQSAEWMKVRREIIEAESKLKHYKAQLASVRYANITAMSGAFKTAGQNMRTAGMYASIGGAALVMTGRKLLELNKVQASAERKLVEIYKTRMGANKKAAKSTMELASALQKQGVIGDEVTLSGAQMLATYAKTPGTVDKLLPAMTNLLVQQKGVDATAEDATATAKLFGKALMGNTGALSRAGITFTDAQAKILKYGTEEEKAAMLAEVVTQNVGNMNEVFADTPEGQLAQLRNDLGDIGESLGALLLPALGKLAGWLKDNVIPALERLVAFLEAHPFLAKAAVAITAFLVVGGPLLIFLGALTSAVGVLLGVIGHLPAILAAIGKAAAFLIANPWVAIITAIAVAALLIIKNWSTVKAFLIKTWNSLKAYATATFARIKSAIVTPIQAAKTIALATIASMKTRISSLFNGIKNAITSPIRTAASIIKKLIEKIQGFFSGASISWPHIPVPYFKITPEGWKAKDLLKGKIPHVHVGFHKEGGIFDSPTLLTSRRGGAHVVGEAGAEAILPLDTLWAHMNALGDSITNGVIAAGAMGGAAAPINITLYAFPNGPEMDRWVVNTYDRGKRRLG